MVEPTTIETLMLKNSDSSLPAASAIKEMWVLLEATRAVGCTASAEVAESWARKAEDRSYKKVPVL